MNCTNFTNCMNCTDCTGFSDYIYCVGCVNYSESYSYISYKEIRVGIFKVVVAKAMY
jgi:hypothetical protein